MKWMEEIFGCKISYSIYIKGICMRAQCSVAGSRNAMPIACKRTKLAFGNIGWESTAGEQNHCRVTAAEVLYSWWSVSVLGRMGSVEGDDWTLSGWTSLEKILYRSMRWPGSSVQILVWIYIENFETDLRGLRLIAVLGWRTWILEKLLAKNRIYWWRMLRCNQHLRA